MHQSVIGRRQVLGGLAASLFMPALTPSSAIAAEGEQRFSHVFGEIVLPRPAERVVSLGYTTQDSLLALGVIPVGIRDWFGDQPSGVWPWAQAHLNGAEPILIKGNVSIEAVAALKPDLIIGIGSGISETEYAALSRVAPVLMQGPEYPAYGMPWDDLVQTVGRAVGKSERASELVSETRQQIADIRQRHPDWNGRTAVAAYHYGGETGVFAPEDTRGRFLTELGFTTTPPVAKLGESGSFYQALSPEDLSAIDADLLVWISSDDTASDLVDLPMRRLLSAHSQGREVFAGGLLAAALSFGSILSLPFVLSTLEVEIAAALDGDPRTPVPSAVKAGLAP
ncbi:iron-siderophore ABC transporter substrate-binding protein (plasmid) [Rhizobium sp. SL42]|nr:iron-siderophore ABC transporter substrate-binding protein [Rhizobium sp. SL42]